MTAERRENRLNLLFVAMAACLMYAVNGGIRSNYGILLGGIMESSGLPYDSVSLAVAVAQLMFGVMQPVFGMLALKKNECVCTLPWSDSGGGRFAHNPRLP